MKSLGLSEHYFDCRIFDPDQVTQQFFSRVSNAEAVKAKTAWVLASSRSQPTEQLHDFFPPVARKEETQPVLSSLRSTAC